MQILANKYQILRELGSGGFSTVFECRHMSTDRTVAVKVLQDGLSPESLKRFRTEAQILSSLDHPNLVKIFEFGLTAENKPFMVMERLQGVTLGHRLETGGPLSPSELSEIFEQLLDALDCLHSRAVVHRDLKPANVMLRFEGEGIHATLLDLGIARRLDTDHKVTGTDVLIGTPYYMSPEQWTSTEVDARSDLYSLGCMMYECSSGKKPFVGSSVELMLEHTSARRPRAPWPIRDLVNRLISTSPETRFQSAKETLSALQSLHLSRIESFIQRDRFASDKLRIATILLTAVCAIYLIFNFLSLQRNAGAGAPIGKLPGDSQITSKRLFSRLKTAIKENNRELQKQALEKMKGETDAFYRSATKQDIELIGDFCCKRVSNDRPLADLAAELLIRDFQIQRPKKNLLLLLVAEKYLGIGICTDSTLKMLELSLELQTKERDRKSVLVKLGQAHYIRHDWSSSMKYYQEAQRLSLSQDDMTKPFDDLLGDCCGAFSYAQTLQKMNPKNPVELEQTLEMTLRRITILARQRPDDPSVSKTLLEFVDFLRHSERFQREKVALNVLAGLIGRRRDASSDLKCKFHIEDVLCRLAMRDYGYETQLSARQAVTEADKTRNPSQRKISLWLWAETFSKVPSYDSFAVERAFENASKIAVEPSPENLYSEALCLRSWAAYLQRRKGYKEEVIKLINRSNELLESSTKCKAAQSRSAMTAN